MREKCGKASAAAAAERNEYVSGILDFSPISEFVHRIEAPLISTVGRFVHVSNNNFSRKYHKSSSLAAIIIVIPFFCCPPYPHSFFSYLFK
jgi:hypothetical protein